MSGIVLPGGGELEPELTDDELLSLIHDLPWYAEHAPLRVKDKNTTERVPMRMRPAQRYVWARLWELSQSGRLVRALVPKARQLGMTTMFLGHKVHIAEVRTDREMYVLMHDLKPARTAWQRLKDMHDGIDGRHVPKAAIVGELKGRLLEFDTGSRIVVESVGKQGVGRSETLHHVHATELPSWDDPETTMDGIEESVPDLDGFETSIILESTSEGVGDWWYWKVQQAKRGQGGYELIFLPWFLEPAYGAFHPKPWELDEQKLRRAGLKGWSDGCGVRLATVLKEDLTEGERQIARRIEREAPAYGITYLTEDLIVAKLLWRRSKIERRGAEKFKQEYPLTVDEGFLGTGRPVFRTEHVQFHKLRRREDGSDMVDAPRQRFEMVLTGSSHDRGQEKQIWTPRESADGGLMVWKGAEKDARYVLGGDPSGAVNDPSALQVVKVGPEELEQVAVFHQHIGQIELAWITAWLAVVYNNAGIVPEATGEGSAYVETLGKIRWPGRKIYQREVIGPDGRQLVRRWGFDMNAATRPAVIETIYNLLGEHFPIFRHAETLMEMEQFTLKKNNVSGKVRADHPTGGHSDLLMAWGIAAHARHQFMPMRHKPTVRRGLGYEVANTRGVRPNVHDVGR